MTTCVSRSSRLNLLDFSTMHVVPTHFACAHKYWSARLLRVQTCASSPSLPVCASRPHTDPPKQPADACSTAHHCAESRCGAPISPGSLWSTVRVSHWATACSPNSRASASRLPASSRLISARSSTGASPCSVESTTSSSSRASTSQHLQWNMRQQQQRECVVRPRSSWAATTHGSAYSSSNPVMRSTSHS